MADLFSAVYNPDVLSCLANLSNDEVFTPPELANEVLDMLPESIWVSTTARFLDPCSKSGVFLREIVKRLIRGQLPDYEVRCAQIDHKRIEGEDLDGSDEAYLYRLQKVIDHILHEQVFGIAITELTSLLTRRSLYCSKWANGPYSVSQFSEVGGNVRFKPMQHKWEGPKGKEKCKWCGASKSDLIDSRTSDETHAYEFIHVLKPERLVSGMNFDVIVGNPPYQLSDGGFNNSAMPIYHQFVQQAKRLNPRYLAMIIPARWYAGGRGLDQFRSVMLGDKRIREIHDYPEASDCFPGVQIKGGVCYFLWSRDSAGDCTVVTHTANGSGEPAVRPLLESGCDTFIRWNEAIPILHKVQEKKEASFRPLVSMSRPFGLRGAFKDYVQKPVGDKTIKLYRIGGYGYVSKGQLLSGQEYIDHWKVLIPRAGSGSDAFPHMILGKPFVAEPNSACTETYLVLGPFASKKECQNVISYIQTRFFRFLVLLHKPSQDATSKVYTFVPKQDFTKAWDDDALREKYGITDEEYQFICTLVRPAGE